MRTWGLVPLVLGSLLLVGCGSSAGTSSAVQGGQLTSKACRDIDSVMTPKQGTVTITWDSGDLSRSPLQEMAAAIDRSPNSSLHSELAVFDSATRSGDMSETLSGSNALLQTCRRLGYGK